MIILAVDPGPETSGVVLWNAEKQKIENKSKEMPNIDIIDLYVHVDLIIIEKIASYGMAVGESTFETCVQTGVLMGYAQIDEIPVIRVPRRDVKIMLCNSMKAKDKNIRQAIIDEYGEPGTKANPNPHYDDSKEKMSSHIWSAFSLIMWWEMNQKLNQFCDEKG